MLLGVAGVVGSLRRQHLLALQAYYHLALARKQHLAPRPCHSYQGTAWLRSSRLAGTALPAPWAAAHMRHLSAAARQPAPPVEEAHGSKDSSAAAVARPPVLRRRRLSFAPSYPSATPVVSRGSANNSQVQQELGQLAESSPKGGRGRLGPARATGAAAPQLKATVPAQSGGGGKGSGSGGALAEQTLDDYLLQRIARARGLYDLEHLLAKHGPAFRAAHITATLTRLPTVTLEGENVGRRVSRIVDVMGAGLANCVQEATAGSVAQVVAALARVLYAPPELVQLLVGRLVGGRTPAVLGCTPQQLAACAWGLARLTAAHGDALSLRKVRRPGVSDGGDATTTAVVPVSCMQTIWPLLAAGVERKVAGMEPQHVADVVWAFGKVERHERRMMEALGPRIVSTIERYTASQLVSVLWGCAALRHDDRVLLTGLCRVLLHKRDGLDGAQLCNAVWATAACGLHHPDFLDALSGRAADSRELWAVLTPFQTAQLVWALATLRHWHGGVLSRLLHKLQNAGPSFSPGQLADVWWGVASLNYHDKHQVQLLEHLAALMTARAREAADGGGSIDAPDAVNVLWSVAVMDAKCPPQLVQLLGKAVVRFADVGAAATGTEGAAGGRPGSLPAAAATAAAAACRLTTEEMVQLHQAHVILGWRHRQRQARAPEALLKAQQEAKQMDAIQAVAQKLQLLRAEIKAGNMVQAVRAMQGEGKGGAPAGRTSLQGGPLLLGAGGGGAGVSSAAAVSGALAVASPPSATSLALPKEFESSEACLLPPELLAACEAAAQEAAAAETEARLAAPAAAVAPDGSQPRQSGLWRHEVFALLERLGLEPVECYPAAGGAALVDVAVTALDGQAAVERLCDDDCTRNGPLAPLGRTVARLKVLEADGWRVVRLNQRLWQLLGSGDDDAQLMALLNAFVAARVPVSRNAKPVPHELKPHVWRQKQVEELRERERRRAALQPGGASSAGDDSGDLIVYSIETLDQQQQQQQQHNLRSTGGAVLPI